MTLEDRFSQFAREQEQPAPRQRGAYEKNLESLKKADALVSRVLEAFCQALDWGLKRKDCCDPAKGAVQCNYIVEHREFWREGFLTVDVDVTWGGQSEPLEAVTVYQGEIVGAGNHARVFASRLSIPFSGLNEEKLAAALEQQSRDIVKRIRYRKDPQGLL